MLLSQRTVLDSAGRGARPISGDTRGDGVKVSAAFRDGPNAHDHPSPAQRVGPAKLPSEPCHPSRKRAFSHPLYAGTSRKVVLRPFLRKKSAVEAL